MHFTGGCTTFRRRLLSGRAPFYILSLISVLLINPGAGAQAIDATSLQSALNLGARGAIAGGDDANFARADFDDSAWALVDERKTIRDVLPDGIPAVVWQRIHVKVDPRQTGLDLATFGVSQAYEVFVNGEKLIASGQVEPFRRYTENARIVAPIPDALVRSGSLTIAVRARALPRWWKGTGPVFPPAMLSIGTEEALRDHALLAILQQNAFNWLLQWTSIAICSVAFALFLAQRQRFEYLWLSLAGLVTLIQLPLGMVEPFRSIPANLANTVSSLDYLGGIFIVIMTLAFVGVRVGKWVWIGLAVSGGLPVLASWAFLYSLSGATLFEYSQIPYQVVTTAGVVTVLLVQRRRGNREAGIILVPMILWGLTAYSFLVFFLLRLIPSAHTMAQSAIQQMAGFTVLGFTVGAGSVTALSFFLSMGFIIVWRSIRASRQQALMETELEATRSIQQIILPQNVESVPGFRIESVYRPAQQVGGDFFQILPTGDSGVLVVVGDVAGKGLPAAMLVSVLVGAIRAIAEYQCDPAKILSRLNDQLVGRGGSFSTALVARISADGQVTVANAGHLSPYLDGCELELPGALPLGVAGSASYEASSFRLAPSSRLTFYSDGVVEAQNQRGELFGFDRARSISTQSAASILEAVQQFGQEDDITVVTLTFTPAIVLHA